MISNKKTRLHVQLLQALVLFSFIFLTNLIYGQFDTNSEILIKARRDLRDIFFVDLNMNGTDDIVAHSKDAVFWLENDGNGNFGDRTKIFEMNNYILNVKVEDIDNDGIKDLLVNYQVIGSSSSFRATIVRQFPIGVFTIESDFLIGTHSQSYDILYNYLVEDINNDSNKDLIVGGISGTRVFINNGSFSFTESQVLDDSKTIVLGDLNNDGWLDLVLCAQTGVFTTALNDGTGNFLPVSSTYSPQIQSSLSNNMAIIDFDNDGDNDLVYARYSGTIETYKNDGAGNFTQFNNINLLDNTNLSYLQTRDINYDGILDLVFIKKYPLISGQFLLSVCYGDNTFFGQNSSIADFNFPSYIVQFDFSDNIGNGTDNFVFYNEIDVDSRFNQLQSKSISNMYDSITIFDSTYLQSNNFIGGSDLDQDGDLDLISPPKIYNNIDNDYFEVQIDSTLVSLTGILFDINNDGIKDFVGFNSNKEYGYWLANGLGGFDAQTILGTDLNIKFVYIYDFNNDGLFDYLYNVQNSAGYKQLYVCLNLGNGNYAPPYMPYSNWLNSVLSSYVPVSKLNFQPHTTEPANIDYSLFGYNQFYIKFNDATAPVSFMQIFAGSISNFVNDIDGDGLFDIVETNTAKLSWHKNMGNHTFEEQIVIEGNFLTLLPNDFDFDNDMDFIVQIDSTLYLLESLGYGEFAPIVPIISNSDSVNQANVRLYDMDLDGDLDLLYNTNINSSIYSSSESDMLLLKGNMASNYEISGKIFWDQNQNGIEDNQEHPITFHPISINSNSQDYTNTNGVFSFGPQLGNHTLNCNLPANWLTSNYAPNFSVNLSSSLPIIDTLAIGFTSDTVIFNSLPDLTGGFPRCNDTINYWISIKNTGTTYASGIIDLELDNLLSYVNSSLTPDSIVNNHIYWTYDSILPFDQNVFPLSVATPGGTSNGPAIQSILINSIIDTNGIIIGSSIDTLNQSILCAYDPNDKSVLPEGIGEKGFVLNNLTMEYLVRFQNTGNDTAINVIIKDKIHPNLDINSLEILSSSFPMDVNIAPGRNVTFEFIDIMLPDSNTNVLGSQGYVKYKINMIPNLVSGEKIENRAEIYFDYNEAILTNTTLNTIFSCDTMPQFIPVDTVLCNDSQFLYEFPTNMFVDSILWSENQTIIGNDSSLLYTSHFPASEIIIIASNDFCNVEYSFTPIVFENLEIENISDSIYLCNGDSVFLYSNYTSGNSWFDSQGIISTEDSIQLGEEGFYWLQSSNEYCNSTDSVYIQLQNISSPTIFHLGNYIISTNSNYTSYIWLDCSNNMAVIPNETDSTYTAIEDGVYAVVVTNEFNCIDTSECFTYAYNALQSSFDNPEFTVHPNPANQQLNISSNNKIIKIELYNLLGEILSSNNSDKVLDVTKVKSGTYYLTVSFENSQSTQKVVIIHD